MNGVTLCADDYSQSPAINQAIVALVEMRRVNAVSCLTLSPTWREDARTLRAVEPPQIGLHFNLTLPFNQSERKVSAILAASMLGTIDRKMIRAAFEKQWHAFIRETGASPDFVDGHQHVHAFPMIRDVILESISRFGSTCWVRTLQPPAGLPAGPFKQRLLERVSHPLAGQLAEAGLTTNQCFAGFRSYQTAQGFRDSFRRWIVASGDHALIMCHPGHPSNDTTDPIRKSRAEEFLYLTSDLFKSDCDASGISLAAECHASSVR